VGQLVYDRAVSFVVESGQIDVLVGRSFSDLVLAGSVTIVEAASRLMNLVEARVSAGAVHVAGFELSLPERRRRGESQAIAGMRPTDCGFGLAVDIRRQHFFQSVTGDAIAGGLVAAAR
jgi:hypothetical protein